MNELRFTFLNTSPFLHVCKLQTNLFFLTRLPSCKKSVYQQGKRTASGINHAVLEMVDCVSFVLLVLQMCQFYAYCYHLGERYRYCTVNLWSYRYCTEKCFSCINALQSTSIYGRVRYCTLHCCNLYIDIYLQGSTPELICIVCSSAWDD